LNFLIFDTETTGFPVNDVPATHPSQARIVQLAWLLLDQQFNELETYNQLFKLPPEVKIHPGAQAQHKKSWEDCDARGVSPREGIDLFSTKFSEADLIVAHNFAFDRQLIDIETQIHTDGWVLNFGQFTPYYCTMQAMTPICKLPKKWKGTDYKWPKLQEAYKYCFGKEFDGAHDALSDVRATAQVFKWLVNNGHYTLPICQTQTQKPQSTQTTLTV